eukprot:1133887-Prorocentrum_minimum.AAC.1
MPLDIGPFVGIPTGYGKVFYTPRPSTRGGLKNICTGYSTGTSRHGPVSSHIETEIEQKSKEYSYGILRDVGTMGPIHSYYTLIRKLEPQSWTLRSTKIIQV